MTKKILVALVITISLYAQDDSQTNSSQETISVPKPTPSQAIIESLTHPIIQADLFEGDNLDSNFILNMIFHYEGNIDASKIFLKHSTNPTIKKITQNIIKDRKTQMEELQALLPELETRKKLYSPKEVTLFNQQIKADWETMLQTINETPLKNYINDDYVSSLIPYYQWAVDTSKQILKYTQNETIQVIAQHIIQTQEKEIESLQALPKRKN